MARIVVGLPRSAARWMHECGLGAMLLLSGCSETSVAEGGSESEPSADAAMAADAETPTEKPVVLDRWVSYGNGPANLFANPGETSLTAANVRSLELKWKLDGEVTAPPAVVDGRAFVSTAMRGLYAFDLTDGRELWHNPDVSSFSAPAYDAETHTIYVNRWEGGVLHAFNADDGTLLWSGAISDQAAVRGWSSPVIARGKLAVGIASSDRGMAFKGGVAVFDLAAQTRAFAYTHAEEHGAGVSVWGGPTIDVEGNAVFAGSGNNYTLADGRSNSLFGVDLSSAELLWNRQLTENDRWAYDCIMCGPDHDFGSNPLLLEQGGRKLLAAGQKSGSFWMVDRATGEVLWEKKLSNTSHAAYGGVLNNGAFDGERILVAANEGATPGKLFALDPDPEAGGRTLWERPVSGLVLAPITVANGLAFVPIGRTLEIIDSKSGETLNVLSADAPVAGAAAVSHGHVFFGSGLSYYQRGAAEPGAFYVFGLGKGSTDATSEPEDERDQNEQFEPGSSTWGAVFHEIITGQGCNGGPLCHGGTVGNLQLSESDAAYEALVNTPAMGTNTADATNPDCADTGMLRVVPGDPERSLFLQKLQPKSDGSVPCGAVMPPTGKLSPKHLEQIRDWIAGGAKRD